MSDLIYFNTIQDRDAYLNNLKNKKNESVNNEQPKTKKKIAEEEIKNKSDFFKNLKNEFLESGSNRKKLIKKLKVFIEDNYKNNDRLF